MDKRAYKKLNNRYIKFYEEEKKMKKDIRNLFFGQIKEYLDDDIYMMIDPEKLNNFFKWLSFNKDEKEKLEKILEVASNLDFEIILLNLHAIQKDKDKIASLEELSA